jgi:hypothetical protein
VCVCVGGCVDGCVGGFVSVCEREKECGTSKAAPSDDLGEELQHVASVLQSVAVCCSLLQSVAACFASVLQSAAVCCSLLQSSAACCSVLQHVAACCSVLQRVAVSSESHTGQEECDVTHT